MMEALEGPLQVEVHLVLRLRCPRLASRALPSCPCQETKPSVWLILGRGGEPWGGVDFPGPFDGPWSLAVGDLGPFEEAGERGESSKELCELAGPCELDLQGQRVFRNG